MVTSSANELWYSSARYYGPHLQVSGRKDIAVRLVENASDIARQASLDQSNFHASFPPDGSSRLSPPQYAFPSNPVSAPDISSLILCVHAVLSILTWSCIKLTFSRLSTYFWKSSRFLHHIVFGRRKYSTGFSALNETTKIIFFRSEMWNLTAVLQIYG